MQLVTHLMLYTKREFIEQAKAFLMATLIRLSRRYPEPTMDNLLHPNSKILWRIWDRFFTYEENPGRVELFKAIRKIWICEYEHDAYYRYRMDWFLEQIVEAISRGEWQPRPLVRPRGWWTEAKRDEDFWEQLTRRLQTKRLASK